MVALVLPPFRGGQNNATVLCTTYQSLVFGCICNRLQPFATCNQKENYMGIIDLTVSCPFCKEDGMHLKSVNTMPVKKNTIG